MPDTPPFKPKWCTKCGNSPCTCGSRGALIHVHTHQACGIAVYDALPRAAQDFLRLSDVELRFWTRCPDEISGDNILVAGGCALEEAHAHSYKLQRNPDGSFTHLTGSVPTVIAQTTRLARDAVKEGRFDEAREHLGKLLHFAVDSQTIWHLTRELTSDQHKDGEADIAENVAVFLPSHEEWDAFKLPHPKSLYESTVAACEDTVRQQLDRVKVVQDKGSIAADPDLCREMLARACGFALACEMYVWKWVASA